MKKLLALCLLGCLLLTACGVSPQPEVTTAHALLQIPQYAELSADLGTELSPTGLSCLSGESLYFLATTAPETGSSTPSLYRAELTPDAKAELLWNGPEVEGPDHFTAVVSLFAGEDGTVWTMETTTHYIFDLPKNFDETTHDKWEYYQFRGNIATFRQFSPEGKELTSFRHTGLNDDYQTAAYYGGKLYCAMERTITVLDTKGTTLSTVEAPAYVTAMLPMEGGLGVMTDHEADGRSRLYLLGGETFTLTEKSHLPMSVYDPSGTAGSRVYFTDRGNLFSWDTAEGKGQKHLDWQDLGRDRADVMDVLTQDGETVVALWQAEAGTSLQLLMLTPDEKKTVQSDLILGVLFPDDNTMALALRFNSKNNGGSVRVADYSEYEALGLGAEEMLRTDMVTGRGPDLLFSSVQEIPVTALAPNRLQDLKPFISNDGALAKQGLMEPLFAAMETGDGRLPSITAGFRFVTAVGNADVLGQEPLTAKRAAELAKTLTGDGFPPAETYTTQSMAFYNLLCRMAGNYDLAGDFTPNTEDFEAGLILTGLYPKSLDWDRYNKKGIYKDAVRVRLGSQLLLSGNYGSFSALAEDLSTVGDAAVLCGWPDTTGGHAFEVWETWGMTTSCKDTDLAWLFLRQILLADVQDSLPLTGFPTNATSFRRAARAAMQRGGESQLAVGKDQITVSDTLTETQFAALEAAIAETALLAQPVESRLADRMYEAVQPYFAGRMTAEQAVTAAAYARQQYLHPEAAS